MVRNPEAVAGLVMVGTAAGGAVMVIVKLPVAVVDTPVAEREIADNAVCVASMGTIPEITPLVLLIVK